MNHHISRRHLLRSSGLVAASGAVLAACGEPQNKTATRLGDAPEVTALKDKAVTDVVLLRTASSMEALVSSILSDTAVSANLSPLVKPLVAAFAADHTTKVGELSSMITSRGGTPYIAPNPKLKTVFGDTAVTLVKNSDQKATDALALAHALETLLASTYQYFVASVTDAPLRADLMELAVSASRKSAVLSQTIRGGAAAIAPAVDANGTPLVSTLPTAFGPLAAVQVILGAPNEAGTRTQITMDTPSLNSYVY